MLKRQGREIPVDLGCIIINSIVLVLFVDSNGGSTKREYAMLR